MGMKEVMGTLSPLYGMTSGKGLFGSAVGLLPALAKDMRDKKKRDAAGREVPMTPQEQAQAAATSMNKGGKVTKYGAGGSASKRADGCATKGKTRGKII